jgi:hypothetical protein
MEDGCGPSVIMKFAKTHDPEEGPHPLMSSSPIEILLPHRFAAGSLPSIITTVKLPARSWH